MDSGMIVILVGAPLVSVLALIGVIYTARQQAKTASNSTGVSQQNANTQEFDIMRQGFVDSIASLRATQSDMRDDAALDRKEAIADRERAAEVQAASEKKMREMDNRIDILVRERTAILDHLLIVESLFPTPPGPPLRPTWL